VKPIFANKLIEVKKKYKKSLEKSGNGDDNGDE
jgi:hypothetical protein